MPSAPHPHSHYIREITSHQPVLYAYVLSMCPDRTAARDVLQETNLVLWEKIGAFEPGTSFKSWAFRIAYFQTLAYHKKVSRSRITFFEPALLEVLAGEAEELLEDFDDRHEALRCCLTKLPPDDLKVIQQHYEEGMTLAAIGGLLGRTTNALKQVLMRIRRSLRACIELHLTAHFPIPIQAADKP